MMRTARIVVLDELPEAVIQGSKVEPFRRPTEVLWSAKQEREDIAGEKSAFNISVEGRKNILEAARRRNGVLQSTVLLARHEEGSERPVPIGTGVAIKTPDGQYGVLTARHVLRNADGKMLPVPIVTFTPPAEVLNKHQRAISNRARDATVGFGMSAPFTRAYIATSGEGQEIRPGLPDLAIAIFDRGRLLERLEGIRLEDGPAYAQQPAWFNIGLSGRVGVDHNAQGAHHRGCWLFSGLFAQESQAGVAAHYTLEVGQPDRVYRRGEYTYYGIDLNTNSHPEYGTFGGFSGSGFWQVRLSDQGERKLRADNTARLTADDLAEPILGGLIFYQAALPDQAPGFELYAHQVTAELLDRLLQAKETV